MRTQLLGGVCAATLWCFLALTTQDVESIQTFLVNPQAKISRPNLVTDVPTTPRPNPLKEKSINEDAGSSSEELPTDEEYYMNLPRLCCWFNGNTFNKKRVGRSVDLLPQAPTQAQKLSRNETAFELKALITEMKRKETISYDPELFDMISDILFGLPFHGPEVIGSEVTEVDDPRADPELRGYLKDVYDLMYAQKNSHPTKNGVTPNSLIPNEVVKNGLKAKEQNGRDKRSVRKSKGKAAKVEMKIEKDEDDVSSGEVFKRSVMSLPVTKVEQHLNEKQRSQSAAPSALSDFLDAVSPQSRITRRYGSEEDFSGARRASDYGWGRHPSRNQPETTWSRPETNKYQQQETGKYETEKSKYQQETNKYQSEMRKSTPTPANQPNSNNYFEELTHQVPDFKMKSPKEIYLEAKRAEELNMRNSVPRQRNSAAPEVLQDKYFQHPVSEEYIPKTDIVEDRKLKNSHDQLTEERNFRIQAAQDRHAEHQARREEFQDLITEERNLKSHAAHDRHKGYGPQELVQEEKNIESLPQDSTSEEFDFLGNFQENADAWRPKHFYPREKNLKMAPQDKVCKNSRREEFLRLTSQKSDRDLEALLFKNEPEVNNERRVREKSMDKTPEVMTVREKLAAKFPNLVNALQTGASLNMDKLKTDSHRETLIQNFLDSHPQLKKNLHLNWRSDKHEKKQEDTLKISSEEESVEEEVSNKKSRGHQRKEPRVMFDDEFKPEDFEVLKLISDLLESNSEVKAKIKTESEEEKMDLPQQRKPLLNHLWATTTPGPMPRGPLVSHRSRISEPEPEMPKLEKSKQEVPKLEVPKPETEKHSLLKRLFKPAADTRPNSEMDSSESSGHFIRWKRSISSPEMEMQTALTGNTNSGELLSDSQVDFSFSAYESPENYRWERETPEITKFPGLTGYPAFSGYPIEASELPSNDVQIDLSMESDESSSSAEDTRAKALHSYLLEMENEIPENFFTDPYDHFLTKFLEMENCLISDGNSCYDDLECKNRLPRTADPEDAPKSDANDDVVPTKKVKKSKSKSKSTANNKETKPSSEKSESENKIEESGKDQKEADVEQSLNDFLGKLEEGNSDKALHELAESTFGAEAEQALEKITNSFERFTFYDLDSEDFDPSLAKALAKKEVSSALKTENEVKDGAKDGPTKLEIVIPEVEKPDVVQQETELETVSSVDEKVEHVEPEEAKPDDTITAINDQQPIDSIETKPKIEEDVAAPESSLNEIEKSEPVETQKSEPETAQEPEPEPPKVAKPKSKSKSKSKSRPTEAPKPKPVLEEVQGSLVHQMPKLPSLPASSGSQLPLESWKENKAALMEKLSANVELGKTAIKNLKEELAISSAEKQAKHSARLSASPFSNQIKSLHLSLRERLAEIKAKDPSLDWLVI